MNCSRCGNVALGGKNLCRACYRKQNDRYQCQNIPAISAGHCHAGTGITPVPDATLAKIARMREKEYRQHCEKQAEAIRQVEVQVKSFFEEIAEEIARDKNRVKMGLQPVVTCPYCSRKLVDGGCYHCRGRNQE